MQGKNNIMMPKNMTVMQISWICRCVVKIYDNLQHKKGNQLREMEVYTWYLQFDLKRVNTSHNLSACSLVINLQLQDVTRVKGTHIGSV